MTSSIVAWALPSSFFSRFDFGPAILSPLRLLAGGLVLTVDASWEDAGLELVAAARRVEDLVLGILEVE